MTATKLLALLVTAMLVSAGAGTVVAMDETTTAANEPTDTPTGEDPDDSDSESSLNLDVDATLDNDTVDLTVTDNGTGIENVSVAAAGEFVGETDANGSLTFETNASEQLNVTLSTDGWSAEYVYNIENGSLVYAGSDVELPEEDEEDGQMGPSENASETAHTVWGTIQEWLDGNRDTNLGKMIQTALGHDNGNAGQANGQEAGQAGSNAGHADEKKPDHAGKDADGERTENPGKQKAAEKKGGQQKADKVKGHEKTGHGKPDVGHDETDGDEDDDGEESDE
jgi:hypothetical protein